MATLYLSGVLAPSGDVFDSWLPAVVRFGSFCRSVWCVSVCCCAIPENTATIFGTNKIRSVAVVAKKMANPPRSSDASGWPG